MSDVSVVVVNWNTRDHILNCIQSLKDDRQKYQKEIIIVDNGSTDGSPDAIEELHPDVHVVRSPTNLGFAAGNNLGLKQAHGRYFALVNSDVFVEPGCMDTLVDMLEADATIGMTGPKVVNPNGTLQKTCMRLPNVMNTLAQTFALHRLFPRARSLSGLRLTAQEHEVEQDVEGLSGTFWVVRREVVEQVGALDENFFFYGEDVDWSLRIRKAGWRIRYQPAVRALHVHAASSSKDPIRFFLQLQKERIRFWRKHHGRAGMVFCSLVIFLHNFLRFVPRGVQYLLIPSQRNGETKLKLDRSAACLQWQISSLKQWILHPLVPKPKESA